MGWLATANLGVADRPRAVIDDANAIPTQGVVSLYFSRVVVQ